MTTVTYSARRTPTVTITTADGEEADQLLYRAEITIEGVNPIRGTTAEERAAGIVQLSLPITVEANTADELVGAAKRGCSVAAYLTPGVTLDQADLVQLEFLAARGVRQALRMLDPSIT